ncbi:hypothetical protein ABIC47_002051 [Leifsonia sp. 563]|uniref:hypothetical protein n=1 Tax=Leifsonia sp. 563 TaxID=3156412 RepID=UPI003390ADCD
MTSTSADLTERGIGTGTSSCSRTRTSGWPAMTLTGCMTSWPDSRTGADQDPGYTSARYNANLRDGNTANNKLDNERETYIDKKNDNKLDNKNGIS